MLHLAALMGALAPFTPAADVQTVPATVRTIDPMTRQAGLPVSPMSARASFGEVPATVKLPAGLSEASYGVLKVGKRDHGVLIGKKDASAALADTLAIDLDGDGAFGESEHVPLALETQQRERGSVTTGAPIRGALPSGVKYVASFMQPEGRPATLSLTFVEYLGASVAAGEIAIVDRDLDGKFGSAGDAWAMVPKDGRPAGEYGLMNLDESIFVAGHRHTIQLAGELLNVSSVAADGPDPAVMAAQRARVEHLWMERFEPGRKEFFEQRGLDATRPLATQPIRWQYLTYADAIALGAKEKKPVFIDVMAFWCVWCYRMDWCTYPDAEVTRALNEDFIAVKIIQEQDLVGDYDLVMKEKLQARGIPAMGIFDGEGNVLQTIGGWKKPEDFLKELAEGKAKFAGQ